LRTTISIAEGGLKLFKLFRSYAAFGNTLLDAVVSCPAKTKQSSKYKSFCKYPIYEVIHTVQQGQKR